MAVEHPFSEAVSAGLQTEPVTLLKQLQAAWHGL
jgi:hypothetical protein